MRPAQSMYLSSTEWQSNLIKWLEEFPTIENGKEFILFDVYSNTVIFMGNVTEHAAHFGNMTWGEVATAARTDGYIILIEDTAEFDEAANILELAAANVDEEVDTIPKPSRRGTEFDDDIQDRRQNRK